MKKRIMSVLICLSMILTLFPAAISASIGGTGTEQDPYLITSVAELLEFAANVNGGTNYEGKVVKLTKSLDLKGVTWTPIGETGKEFKGTFDGGHHVIDGLAINSDEGFTAFFGRTKGANIKNLGIVNADIVSSGCDVAILVGNTIGGTIENCFVTGSVKGYSGVGALIGSTHGSYDDTVVKNCYARASLEYDTARGDCAGIAGWNYSGSIHIINSYSSCIGEVRPIAGWSDDSPVQNERFENVYFDKSLSPDFSASAGRTDLGKTSDELKTQATFVGYDFTDIWAIDSTVNGGYPYLQGFDGVSLSGAPGTLTVILTDEGGNAVEDATVKAVANQQLNLVHQKNGIYSTTVPNESVTYSIIVNDTEMETVLHNGTEAVEKSYLLLSTSGDTYTYAYDVQRSPSFPAKKGAEITINSFSKPLKYGSVSGNMQTYSSNEGTWVLTEAGAYSEKSGFVPSPTAYLDNVVNSVATKYGLSEEGKAGLVIHKLTDENDTLVGYGIVIGVDETNGYALFIGDLWNTDGAGYLLSKTEINENSIVFKTEQMAQSTYSVELDQETIIFADATEGYSVPAAKTVKVTNTGDAACGALTISLSGSDFVLDKNSISDIAVGGNDTFTVVPKEGLLDGTYTETITVSGDKIMPVVATVSFTVSQVVTPTYTVTFDANGGTVAPANDTTTNGKLTSLPVPTRSGSYTFNGWFTASSGGTQVTVDTVYTENTTIYAQWTYTGGSSGRKTNKCNVIFVTDGGSVVKSQSVSVNNKVTEPAEPVKDGFAFGGWYTDKEFKNAYDFDSKVTKGFTLYAKWNEASGHTCPSEKFSDLDTAKWYHEDIDYVLVNNIMVGIADTEFSPEGNLTRGMLVTILYRSEGEPATNRSIPFADIDMGAYYANAVVWAQQNGIVKGISETEYAPDMNVTREQLATIMFRYAAFKGMDAVTMEENLHFEDTSAIAEYAISGMNWAVGKNYIFSRTDGKINPKETATRAEVAAFIHRYIEN